MPHIGPRLDPSASFPIYYSLINQQFEAAEYGLLKASLNKIRINTKLNTDKKRVAPNFEFNTVKNGSSSSGLAYR
jgi:hypothetical protein